MPYHFPAPFTLYEVKVVIFLVTNLEIYGRCHFRPFSSWLNMGLVYTIGMIAINRIVLLFQSLVDKLSMEINYFVAKSLSCLFLPRGS